MERKRANQSETEQDRANQSEITRRKAILSELKRNGAKPSEIYFLPANMPLIIQFLPEASSTHQIFRFLSDFIKQRKNN